MTEKFTNQVVDKHKDYLRGLILKIRDVKPVGTSEYLYKECLEYLLEERWNEMLEGDDGK